MGQALPFVHRLLLPAPRGHPEGGAYAFLTRMHAASLEALRVIRPEAVDLDRINIAARSAATAVAANVRCRRAQRRPRTIDGSRQAETGSSASQRSRSSANSLGVE